VSAGKGSGEGAGNRLQNRLWGLAALLVGLAGLGYCGRIMVLAAGQSVWVPVQATVVQSHSTQRSKGSGFATHTSAHFAYSYEVDGQVFTSSRYSFWSVGGSKSSGIRHHEVGDSITVFHHHERPEIAVVERERPSVFVWMIVVFALVFAVRGAVMIRTGTAAG